MDQYLKMWNNATNLQEAMHRTSPPTPTQIIEHMANVNGHTVNELIHNILRDYNTFKSPLTKDKERWLAYYMEYEFNMQWDIENEEWIEIK